MRTFGAMAMILSETVLIVSEMSVWMRLMMLALPRNNQNTTALRLIYGRISQLTNAEVDLGLCITNRKLMGVDLKSDLQRKSRSGGS